MPRSPTAAGGDWLHLVSLCALILLSTAQTQREYTGAAAQDFEI
eukprot:SAG11_NODE_15031_length_591_cov_0.947154_1_plen_43_part_10